jgi:hypothetical protein
MANTSNKGISLDQINAWGGWYAALKSVPVAANALSTVVTTSLNAALSTLGVASQAATMAAGANVPGVFAAPPQNFVSIYGTNRKPVLTSTGRIVYGRLTVAGGVWTLSYFTWDGAAEAAYTFAEATSIDIVYSLFTHAADRPSGWEVLVTEYDLSSHSSGGNGLNRVALNTTAQSTIADMADNAPTGNALLVVNGVQYDSNRTNPFFTVSGKSVTWSFSNAGFHLPAGMTKADMNLVLYFY